MFTRFLASSAVAAWTIASVVPIASCGPTCPHNAFAKTPAAGIDVKPLAPYLSSAAQIYYQGSESFTNYTVRWSNLSPPTPNLVIAPGTEKDVAEIVSSTVKVINEKSVQFLTMPFKVKFAAERDIPILAYNGHHGTLTSLGKMDHGIQIYMPQLNTISIAKNKKSATIGGGTNSKKLTDALWAAGKQTGTSTLFENFS
jgi:hypothetical protein